MYWEEFKPKMNARLLHVDVRETIGSLTKERLDVIALAGAYILE